MKKILFIATLMMTFSIALQAQNIGFSINRGVSGFYPNHAFKRSHSQMLGVGLTHYAELKEFQGIQTGMNLSAQTTTGSFINSAGDAVDIPDWYFYLDIPIILESVVYNHISRHGPKRFIKALYGVNGGFLWHDTPMEEESAQKSDMVNYGGTVGIQYVQKETKTTEFAIGPQIKLMTTGQEGIKYNVSYSIRLDWRFNY